MMRNYFLEQLSGALLPTFGFVAPHYLMQCIALYGVAEGWLLLDIG